MQKSGAIATCYPQGTRRNLQQRGYARFSFEGGKSVLVKLVTMAGSTVNWSRVGRNRFWYIPLQI